MSKPLPPKLLPSPEVPLPQSLRAAIERDLRPVKPLRAPWSRVLVFLPLGLGLLAGIPVYFGIRGDFQELGQGLLWGLSGLQLAFGLTLLGLALQECVPARGRSRPALLGALGTGLAVVLAVTLATESASPIHIPPRATLWFWQICFGTSVLLGIPLLGLASLLALRALPFRPALAGSLYGMGCGLLVDAGWRVYCHVSQPSHVLLSHGGSVLLLSALGALTLHLGTRWLGGRR